MKDILLALSNATEAEDLTRRIDFEGLACEQALSTAQVAKLLMKETFSVAVIDASLAADLDGLLRQARAKRPSTIAVVIANRLLHESISDDDSVQLVLYRPIDVDETVELLCGLVKTASRAGSAERQ